ncbi:hypothetical protein D3C77_777450 [compost metagenome]
MVDAVAADELVNELAALIVAHVDHSPAITGFTQRRILVFEATQRRALDGG